MMQEQNPAVGGEIDSWCTRCQLLLNHIVVAKVDGKVKRVQCLTCKGQHAYKAASVSAGASAAARAASAPAPRKPAARTRRPPVDDGRAARDYSPREKYAANEFILHPQYGRGRVAQVRGDKIDVDFTSAARTLIHGRKA